MFPFVDACANITMQPVPLPGIKVDKLHMYKSACKLRFLIQPWERSLGKFQRRKCWFPLKTLRDGFLFRADTANFIADREMLLHIKERRAPIFFQEYWRNVHMKMENSFTKSVDCWRCLLAKWERSTNFYVNDYMRYVM